MSKYKATINFNGYSGSGLAPVAQTIDAALNKNAGTFPNLPVKLSDLDAQIGAYTTALAQKDSRASEDILAFNSTRAALQGMLNQIGTYVNSVAAGDVTIIEQAGYPYYAVVHNPPHIAPPPAPTSAVARPGALSGSVALRFRPFRSPSQNEVQTCTADPLVETNWQHAGMFSGGKATVSALTPATTVWFRIRTAGLRGVMGQWCNPVKIIVV